MIRKISIVFLALFLMMGLWIPVAAEGTEWYYLDELSIAVPIPEDMFFISRHMNEDDPVLAELEETPQSILEQFIEYDIYFQLWSYDAPYVISFNMTTIGLKNMSDYDEAEMQDFTRYITNQYSHTGDMEVYRSSRGTFLRFTTFSIDDESDIIYSMYYVTVYRGNMIEIQLFTSDKPATAQQKDALKAVVDQVYFGDEKDIFENSTTPKTTTSSKTSKVTLTAAFTYTDSKVDTSFTVPENWSRNTSAETSRYVQAVFFPNDSSDAMIEYGSEDEWLTDFYLLRDGTTRAEINNDYFSVAEIADMFDLSASQVTTEYVGGVEYFKFIEKQDDYKVYNMIIYHNAVFYWFTFYGEEGTRYYNDFISLLKSVKYPAVSVPESSVSEPASPVDNKAGSPAAVIREFNANHEILFIALSAVLFALPILLYRYALRRRPVMPKQALVIVLICGGVSLAVMTLAAIFLKGSWVAVGMVLLWHIVGYYMLTQGRQMNEQVNMTGAAPPFDVYDIPVQRHTDPGAYTQTAVASIPRQADMQEQPLYCEICGMKLRPGSKFCPNCGEKVIPLVNENMAGK